MDQELIDQEQNIALESSIKPDQQAEIGADQEENIGTNQNQLLNNQGEKQVEAEVFTDSNTKAVKISNILRQTALPMETENTFLSMTLGTKPISPYQLERMSLNQLKELINQVDAIDIHETLINNGNFIDIEAELRAHRELNGDEKWMNIAEKIVNIKRNQQFIYSRKNIMFGQLKEGEIESMIDEGKRGIVHDGGSIENISWDSVSYKVEQSTAECFIQYYPEALTLLTENECAVLNNAEEEVMLAIKQACAEYRARTQTTPDKIVPDHHIFLEHVIGSEDSNDRQEKIKAIGQSTLIRYVGLLQPIFAAGHLPGSVIPAKIWACHDSTSILELRAAIVKLAEEQVSQQSDVMQNPHIRRRMEIIGQGIDSLHQELGRKQQISIATKGRVELGYKLGLSSINGLDEVGNQQKNLKFQLTGGSNTLKDLTNFKNGQQGERPINLSIKTKEQLKQQLSLLLACIRIRMDALSLGTFETATEDDFEHLEIVKALSGLVYSGDNVDLFNIANLLQQGYEKGHNAVKMEQYQLPTELIELILHMVMQRMQIIAQGVRLFAEDLSTKGPLIHTLLQCIVKTLCQKSRNEVEMYQRYIRRYSFYNIQV